MESKITRFKFKEELTSENFNLRVDEIENALNNKSDPLKAGENITISEDMTISAIDSVYDDAEIKNKMEGLEMGINTGNERLSEISNKSTEMLEVMKNTEKTDLIIKTIQDENAKLIEKIKSLKISSSENTGGDSQNILKPKHHDIVVNSVTLDDSYKRDDFELGKSEVNWIYSSDEGGSGIAITDEIIIPNLNIAYGKGTSYAGMFARKRVTKVTALGSDNITSYRSMFDGCENLKKVDLLNLNSSKVESVNSMFTGCAAIEEIDLSTLDFTSVVSAERMFSGCSKLKKITFSNSGTPKLVNIKKIFDGCSALEELDLSGFTFNLVYRTSGAFWNCEALKNVYVKDEEQRNILLSFNDMSLSNKEEVIRVKGV